MMDYPQVLIWRIKVVKDPVVLQPSLSHLLGYTSLYPTHRDTTRKLYIFL